MDTTYWEAACGRMFVYMHTQTLTAGMCTDYEWKCGVSVILQHAEHSHKAESTSTAEPASYRDNISVPPQRAAGVTMVNFSVFPGLLSTTEDKSGGKYILLCVNRANISFF